jgi:hypothetical protein
MLFKLSLASLALLASSVSAACSAAERVRTSRQVGVGMKCQLMLKDRTLTIYAAYNAKGLGASAEAFKLVCCHSRERQESCCRANIYRPGAVGLSRLCRYMPDYYVSHERPHRHNTPTDCVGSIPNGLGCGIPVATTGAGTYQFAGMIMFTISYGPKLRSRSRNPPGL